MSRIPQIVRKYESEILSQWISEMSTSARRADLMRDEDLRSQARTFLALVTTAMQSGNLSDVRNADWAPVREQLAEITRIRVQQGFPPSDVAMFVFSLKKPIFARLMSEFGSDGKSLAEDTWTLNDVLDRLGLLTTETYQKLREEIIARQQEEMLELSTPVVKLWDRIVAVPLIGTLDSQRTQVVMEALLQEIVQTGSEVAIIDITGVPTVDTLVAQHLLKTVTAARLMGADCIISGIRPQTAQTIVHLGVDLGEVVTKATLADAFRLALARLGSRVVKKSKERDGQAPAATTQNRE